MLDSWIRVDPNGAVTVLTGKVELGQGIKTALIAVAAEELDVAPATITLITADTARTNDEGVTSGSHSMQESGTAIANAAANVRALLIAAAAARWNTPPSGLTVSDGVVSDGGARRLDRGFRSCLVGRRPRRARGVSARPVSQEVRARSPRTMMSAHLRRGRGPWPSARPRAADRRLHRL